MKSFNWLVIFLTLSLFAAFAFLACGDDGDGDDDDDVSETCDLEALEQQAADLCGTGGEVRYSGIMATDQECGASCVGNEIAYWYDQYGACINECFCCGAID